MFKKVLIANRGEIAVRILQTCREMGIRTLALYQRPDRGSLHVRLADEAAEVENLTDDEAVLAIAKARGADAIHPGYGFLAERPAFARACEAAGITFIGPSPAALASVAGKLYALERARGVGIPAVQTIEACFESDDVDALHILANEIGYPLIIKSCVGGRGRGERLVSGPERLADAFRRAQRESHMVYGDDRVYLEKAVLPAHQVSVQIVADRFGNVVHLGDREGSLIQGNRKLIEEAPAPCLTPEGRARLLTMAVELTKLLGYENVGTVEFLVDGEGNPYFTEFKARLQVEHPLSEVMTQVDLVREQIRLAAGEPLGWTQDEVAARGHAILCRVNAEDPWNHALPSPGELRSVRLPTGPGVRLDTYVYTGIHVPAEFDPLVLKLTTWARDRATCIGRFGRALRDIVLDGVETNLPLLERIISAPAFIEGNYSTDLLRDLLHAPNGEPERLRDLAVAAAVLYAQREMLRTAGTESSAQGRSAWKLDGRTWES